MDNDQKTSSQALAERIGATRYDLRVTDVTALTPSMRRIKVAAEGLAALDSLPGQDMMLSVAAPDGSLVRRRYSIRSHNREEESLTLDIVLHGDGPGARWAAHAEPGDVVEAIGPRGKISPQSAAPWHLFVGDESFLPAIFAMAESLPATTPATVLIEVDGTDDELPFQAPACPQGPRWVHRAGAPENSPTALLAALGQIERPEGKGHAYIGGEFHAVRAVSSTLADQGLEHDQISLKAYWRAGSSNASHGEPE